LRYGIKHEFRNVRGCLISAVIITPIWHVAGRKVADGRAVVRTRVAIHVRVHGGRVVATVGVVVRSTAGWHGVVIHGRANTRRRTSVAGALVVVLTARRGAVAVATWGVASGWATTVVVIDGIWATAWGTRAAAVTGDIWLGLARLEGLYGSV
jgi:hypothetical protein